jgi:hypothetical protein
MRIADVENTIDRSIGLEHTSAFVIKRQWLASILLGMLALTGMLSGPRALAQPLETAAPYQARAGDLLFQDLNCGPFCQAIEAVTEGANGQDFSHIAMMVSHQGAWFALEAVSEGVVRTPLDSFLQRRTDSLGRPMVWVGRVQVADSVRDKAAAYALQQRGAPYDPVFVMGDERYYCSELMYEAYAQAAGHEVFPTAPMTFREPGSGAFFPAWKAHFRDFNVAIPQGEPGINPGLISRHPSVRIVHRYFPVRQVSGESP